MHLGRTVFAQILDYLPRHDFDKCIRQYDGNWHTRYFSCFDQFLCMAFAQLTGRESLREIETCLNAMHSKLYHCGLRGSIARSTLADANHQRDWHIYYDFAQVLIRTARPLYAHDSFGVELEETTYALDSTMIELCRSLFPWAHYRRDRGAVKLHSMLDLRGNIPCQIYISDGKAYDTFLLDRLEPEPGAIYIMDRGYVDYARLAIFTEHLAYFVVRARGNLAYSRRAYRSVDYRTGLRSDQTIALRTRYSAQRYPYPLRYISYFDAVQEQRLVFLTNHFPLEALKIAQLYKCRWQIELFFKWIKQHLRIKTFYGTSHNAVCTQIWIAISVYALLATIKKSLNLKRSISEIQQILSITLFEQSPLSHVLTRRMPQTEEIDLCNQLILFDL
jgi:hypothetical protein